MERTDLRFERCEKEEKTHFYQIKVWDFFNFLMQLSPQVGKESEVPPPLSFLSREKKTFLTAHLSFKFEEEDRRR